MTPAQIKRMNHLASVYLDKYKSTTTTNHLDYRHGYVDAVIDAKVLVEALEFIKTNLINSLKEPERQSFWRATEALKLYRGTDDKS